MRDKRVAILESRLGRQMVELVAKRGAVAIHAPALAEVPDVDPNFVKALVGELCARPPELVIFQTGVGTQALFATTDRLGATDDFVSALAAAKVAARGPKPTVALRARHIRIDFPARDPFTTREVLEAIQGVAVDGKLVVVQRYGMTNADLEEALKARGAKVVEIPTYRWALPADTKPLIDLIDRLARREIDAVVITSASQIHNLFEVATTLGRAEALRADLAHTLIASIGPVASAALRQRRLDPGLEASPPKLGPLIGALDSALSR
jgi:uroporphyrinogen-III synthase